MYANRILPFCLPFVHFPACKGAVISRCELDPRWNDLIRRFNVELPSKLIAIQLRLADRNVVSFRKKCRSVGVWQNSTGCFLVVKVKLCERQYKRRTWIFLYSKSCTGQALTTAISGRQQDAATEMFRLGDLTRSWTNAVLPVQVSGPA